MPKLGDICSDCDLNLPNYYRKYIYTACKVCGKERYVLVISGKPAHSLCRNCCHIKHGDSFTRLYGIWHNMINRCRHNVAYYGAKGIKVCSDWNDYLIFKNWSLCNGYGNTLTIDRINSDDDYKPNNCHWIPLAINATKEIVKPVEQLLDGGVINRFMSISDASRDTGVSITAISEVCNGKRNTAKGFAWRFRGKNV